MINRLVYEVRLRKTQHKPRWRWDLMYLVTTDPEYPGVETGRKEISHDFGYTRFKWQAVKQITDRQLNNPFQAKYREL